MRVMVIVIGSRAGKRENMERAPWEYVTTMSFKCFAVPYEAPYKKSRKMDVLPKKDCQEPALDCAAKEKVEGVRVHVGNSNRSLMFVVLLVERAV